MNVFGKCIAQSRNALLVPATEVFMFWRDFVVLYCKFHSIYFKNGPSVFLNKVSGARHKTNRKIDSEQ